MDSIERLIDACRDAIARSDAEKTVRELVAEVVSDPSAVATAVGEPERAGFRVLHREPTVTVLDFAWAPWMCFKPHNHCMWSVVGLYAGREDNFFWRRREGSIEAAGARSLCARDVTVLGRDIIHSVVNPIGKRTRALHVYGGDFFAPPTPRSEWDPETLVERPWDVQHTLGLFEAAERRSRVVE